MLCWQVDLRAPIEDSPLKLVEKNLEPAQDEVLVEVNCCGVCRTDLHVVEGDLPAHKSPVTPGHEVVGTIISAPKDSPFAKGQKVGIAWVQQTCKSCKYCRAKKENLCLKPTFTGYDVDGGYAQQIVTKTDYLYEISTNLADKYIAPLLCSGIIGYRAFKLLAPSAGSIIGIYGFGASAHLTAQLAIKLGFEIYAFSRSEKGRSLAQSLGATFVADPSQKPPKPIDNALVFAPSGEIASYALRSIDRGGKVVIAGIYSSAIPELNYDSQLFYEKVLTTATANTYQDAKEFLTLAERLEIKPIIQEYQLEKDAQKALYDLKHNKINGAGVLIR